MLIMSLYPILVTILVQWTGLSSTQSVNWDDLSSIQLFEPSKSSPSTTSTTVEPPSSSSIEPLFDSSPCYLALCEDNIIQTIRNGIEFADQIRCHQLDSQCHCCLRKQLARSELDKLYQSIGAALESRGYRSNSPNSGSHSSGPVPSSIEPKQLCKVLNCDDYQVRAIKSLDDPNSECRTHGDPSEGQCECCVKSNLKPITRSEKRSTFETDSPPSISEYNQPRQKNRTANKDPFDFDSDFFSFFPSSNRSPSLDSSRSSLNLFDVDCPHYPCNDPQVKSIKRLPSQVITCVKMGNTNRCKCCFNSTLSILERVQYEIQLTNHQSKPQSQSTPSSGPTSTSSPPYLRSPSFPSTSSSSSPFEPSIDCSLHHCKSDFVQLIDSVPTHIIKCKPLSSASHCRCCLDSNLSSTLNLRSFLNLFNL